MANEHTQIFQAKTKVDYRTLSVDKIIQGTSDIVPERLRVTNVHKESSVVRAELMMQNYKEGLKKSKSSKKFNPDFLSAKRSTFQIAESPEVQIKSLLQQDKSWTDLPSNRKINYGNQTSSFLTDVLYQPPKTERERISELSYQLKNEKKLASLVPKEPLPVKTHSQFSGNYKNATSEEFSRAVQTARV